MTLKVKILHLISSVPSLILSLVALEHLMKEIQGDHFWRKVMHPWFMFAAPRGSVQYVGASFYALTALHLSTQFLRLPGMFKDPKVR